MRVLLPVWQIRDVYPRSWIMNFTQPGSRIQKRQEKRGEKQIICHTFNIILVSVILLKKY